VKRFFGLAAFGVVAIFLALPTPAAAWDYIGRYNSWGSRTVVIGRPARYWNDGWTTSRRAFRRGWGPGYYCADYYYPYATYYPDAPTYYSAWYGGPAPRRFVRRGWWASYYVGDYRYAYPTYYPGTATSYGAYYEKDPPADPNAATVRMHVASGAHVWFDGDATSETGTDRAYVSPALEQGHEYVYHIRVQWSENNQPVERKRDITVHAGDRIALNFNN
jgi:uncharacterized protein (TIGR03000 family)